MTDIVNKCEEAYSLIQKCQNNDSALVEEKTKIGRLVGEISTLMEKCELEPVEKDNLTYYFEYDIAYTLENTIGEIRLLKPGQIGLLPFIAMLYNRVVVCCWSRESARRFSNNIFIFNLLLPK